MFTDTNRGKPADHSTEPTTVMLEQADYKDPQSSGEKHLTKVVLLSNDGLV